GPVVAADVDHQVPRSEHIRLQNSLDLRLQVTNHARVQAGAIAIVRAVQFAHVVALAQLHQPAPPLALHELERSGSDGFALFFRKDPGQGLRPEIEHRCKLGASADPVVRDLTDHARAPSFSIDKSWSTIISINSLKPTWRRQPSC